MTFNTAHAPLGKMSFPQLRDWPLLLFAAALLLGFLTRVLAGWNLPFWFDETFTGAIAAQPDLHSLIRWCLSELTGPAFYVPMWLWAKLAGISDTALRAPALAFSLATPLMIARWGHQDRSLRLCWAALVLLWLPVLPTAMEARPYPQLLFLCSLQAMMFLRVMRSPSTRNATLWATAASLTLLTHYYATSIVALQGLAILVAQRRALLRLLPAAVPFCLAGIWIAYHLSFLLGFAETRMANYAALPVTGLLLFPVWLFGGLQGFAILVPIAATARLWWASARSFSPEAQLVWIGVAATALLVATGAIGATIMPRYFTPAIPALLFGIACWMTKLRREAGGAVLVMSALFFFPMAMVLVAGSGDWRFVERRYFEFETASDWLMERQPARLHFLWSTPTGEISRSDDLADVAGFFFARSGHPVQVIVARASENHNSVLGAAAGQDPSAAILWVSDNGLPPAVRAEIDRQFPGWECRDFGGEGILIYACRRSQHSF